jgi:hypothetical protein
MDSPYDDHLKINCSHNARETDGLRTSFQSGPCVYAPSVCGYGCSQLLVSVKRCPCMVIHLCLHFQCGEISCKTALPGSLQIVNGRTEIRSYYVIYIIIAIV